MALNLILPGDSIPLSEEENNSTILLGPGFTTDPKSQSLLPVNAGVFHSNITKKSTTTLYVDYDSKRYIPSVGDYVIGIITHSYSDSYRVALQNFISTVSLSYMAFPNASKKNRPNLKIGDLVYARVSSAEPELECEIECIDPVTGKDAGFGLLQDGMIVDVTLQFARTLLFDNDNPLLLIFAKLTKFEIAIGLNGKIWFNTPDVRNTLAIYSSIEKCNESRDSKEYESIVKSIFKKIVNTVE